MPLLIQQPKEALRGIERKTIPMPIKQVQVEAIAERDLRTESLNLINQRIEQYKKAIAKLQENLKTAEGSTINSIMQLIRERERQIYHWEAAKHFAEQGLYSPETIESYVESRIAGHEKEIRQDIRDFKLQQKLKKIKTIEEYKKFYEAQPPQIKKRLQTPESLEISSLSQEAKRIEQESKGRFKPVYSKGKLTGFKDTQAGMSIPLKEFNVYVEELSKIPEIKGEKIIYKSGKPIGIESEYFGKTLSKEEYEKEIKRLEKVMPEERWYDPITQKVYKEERVLFKDKQLTLSSTPIKIYTTPEGEPIQDIEKYIKEKKIPVRKESTKLMLNAKPVFDIKTLYTEGTVYLPKWEKESLKGVSPITATDITTIAFGGIGLVKGGIIKGLQIGLSKPITKVSSFAIEKIIPSKNTGFSPSGIPRQVGRGALFLITMPVTGISYATEMGKGFLTQPIASGKGMARYAIKNPYEIGTVIIGGKIGGKIKSKAIQAKIKEALKEATITPKYKGRLSEKQLDIYKIPETQKAEIRTLLKEGYTVRKVEVGIKAKKGFEKYTPSITGEILEVVTKGGKIIKKYAMGELEITLGKQKVSKLIKSETLARINQKTGKIEGYTEVYQAILKRGKLKKPTITKFKEETELIRMKRLTKQKRALLTETKTEFLGKEKYKGEPLLIKYKAPEKGIQKFPDYSKLKGKLYSIGEALEIQKFKKGRVDIVQVGDTGLIGGQYIADIYGLVKIHRIKAKIKPKKIIKEFKKEKPSRIQESNLMQTTYQASELITSTSTITPLISQIPTRFVRVRLPTFAFGMARIQPMGISTKLFIPEISYGGLKIFPKTLKMTKVKPKIKEKFAEEELSLEFMKTGIKEETALISAITPIQAQIQKIELRQKFRVPKTPMITPPSPVINITYPEKIIFGLELPIERKAKIVEKEGYDAYAYIDATKKRKARWKKLNKEPLTKESALSESARYVDTTISARGKVMKSKSKKKPIDLRENYFEDNRQKFRTFRQKRGRRTELPNSFIERQKYRLDTRGETRRLQKEKSVRSMFGF